MKNLFYSIEGFKGTMWQNGVIIYEIKTNDEKALNGEYNFIETPEIIASKIKQYLIENLPKNDQLCELFLHSLFTNMNFDELFEINENEFENMNNIEKIKNVIELNEIIDNIDEFEIEYKGD